MRIHGGPPSMHNHTGRSTLDLPCRALKAALTQERFLGGLPGRAQASRLFAGKPQEWTSRYGRTFNKVDLPV